MAIWPERKERLSEEEAREREERLRARGFQPERPAASTVTLLERRKREEELREDDDGSGAAA